VRPDTSEVQAFYASPHGQLARRLVLHQIRQLWPDLRGRVVVGIGHAQPFLAALDDAERTLALVPNGQSAAPWPADGRRRIARVDETDLPLGDGVADCVLLAHGLETSARLKRLLREVWRVLADGGRLIALVPNRTGLWCWSERTPFGHGQPYSAGQLEKTLRRHLLEPVASGHALYLPPTGSRLLLRLAIPLERLGTRFAPQLSGVLLIEAEKRIAVATAELVKPRRQRRRVTVPLAQARDAA
jgi:SAM-dependent methyltransferase